MSVGFVDQERQRRDELACRFAEYIDSRENLAVRVPDVMNFFYELRELKIVNPENFNFSAESPEKYLGDLFIKFLLVLAKERKSPREDISIHDQDFYDLLAQGLKEIARP